MIFGPILLILVLLLSVKEGIGCGLFGTLLGVERIITEGGCQATNLPGFLQIWQNAAGDAGSAGWWAVALADDPPVRGSRDARRARKLLDALSNAGILISTLYLMFLAVSIIDFCLKFTSLPVFISLDVLSWLKALDLGGGGALAFQFIALIATMLLAVLLGMGMPAVPAYVNVALLMGPVLAGLGIAVFTAHMFIFYFAVASAITPPVAWRPSRRPLSPKRTRCGTGFAAVKIGIVMFVIPFVFAMYPEILLIEQAFLDPTASATEKAYLPGYDGTVHIGALALILARLILALYLLASALAAHDAHPMAFWEWPLRLVLAGLVMAGTPAVWGAAVVCAVALLVWHRIGAKAATA